MKQQPNPFNQTYALSDVATQQELLIATLRSLDVSAVDIVTAIGHLHKRVDRFYNGTSKYNGNGELKNV